MHGVADQAVIVMHFHDACACSAFSCGPVRTSTSFPSDDASCSVLLSRAYVSSCRPRNLCYHHVLITMFSHPLSPQDISSLCWSLGCLERSSASADLAERIATEAERTLAGMSPRQMASVLWGLGAAAGGARDDASPAGEEAPRRGNLKEMIAARAAGRGRRMLALHGGYDTSCRTSGAVNPMASP